jgi:hypothetical protein
MQAEEIKVEEVALPTTKTYYLLIGKFSKAYSSVNKPNWRDIVLLPADDKTISLYLECDSDLYKETKLLKLELPI